jgi:hypothetical protein
MYKLSDYLHVCLSASYFKEHCMNQKYMEGFFVEIKIIIFLYQKQGTIHIDK